MHQLNAIMNDLDTYLEHVRDELPYMKRLDISVLELHIFIFRSVLIDRLQLSFLFINSEE